MAAQLHDVVMTGVGVVSAAGRGVAGLWSCLDGCRSALSPLPPALDDPHFACRVAGTVDEDLLRAACGEVGIRGRDDRSVKLALLAAFDALTQAGVVGDERWCRSCGVVIGTGAGALSPTVEAVESHVARGVRAVRPTVIPRTMPSAAACGVSIRYGLKGGNRSVAAACASATMAMGDAFRQIRHGYASCVLCGGTEALSERVLYAAWSNMGVLAAEDGIAGGCRPFDAASGGMVLGEGAAMFVLEREASARARGAVILGRVLGYGESSDATHMTQPDPAGQLPAMTACLSQAGVDASGLGAIQAHGTGTEPSDRAESESLSDLLGAHVHGVPVVSTKAVTGHALGASGAIESVVALEWLRHGKVTPNISLRHPREGCGLHLPVAVETLARPLVLNCAFAFGGANAVLLLGRE